MSRTRLIVAGGFGDTTVSPDNYFLNTVEYWNGSSWVLSGTTLAVHRAVHTATLLPNGQILIAGGYGNTTGNTESATFFTSAELLTDSIDSGGGISDSSTGSMNHARYNHTATLLPSGLVLVAGGNDGTGDITECELYNPATGTWSVTGSMATAREAHTATSLPNGKVLVTGGGNGTTSCEIYDPSAGTWSTTGSMHYARTYHTAVLLQCSGEVLVAGGGDAGDASTSAELYNPETGTWTVTGSMNIARTTQGMNLLPISGKVLVDGGLDPSYSALSSAELYDPTSGTWSMAAPMANEHGGEQHTSTLMPNGKVLVVGGGTDTGWTYGTDLYNP